MRQKQTPVDNYLLELRGPLDPALLAIEQQLERDNLLGINIGVAEGTILAFFMKAFDVQSVLEIGTQYGYSTTWFLQNMKSTAKIISIEKNETHFAQAQKNILDERCTLICGDAKKVLSEQLQNHIFDLIFIDANKKAYPDYLR
ncbi:MAG: class I SAM-dependent methyltransferase [Bdellovibrionaceae bacterium]|nr:class I SAM-dependent methyltransferase [Pseudobdellovibrionaceae bacterium]